MRELGLFVENFIRAVIGLRVGMVVVYRSCAIGEVVYCWCEMCHDRETEKRRDGRDMRRNGQTYSHGVLVSFPFYSDSPQDIKEAPNTGFGACYTKYKDGYASSN